MSMSAPPVPYRADIDGLRGVAVLAVVLYHFGIGSLGGGFVGVDIFFVISGFLITAIVQAEISQGRFTYARFYERRVRRLFPALFATLLVTTLVGTWWLLPTDLMLLGKGVLATMLFASNVFFWRQSGYFDNDSAINPLLHTWSLAVEEQFYIGLPILLMLTHRFARRHLTLVLSLAAIVSLLACLLVQPTRPSATFYLSPFRAWELLAGSLLGIGAVPAIRHRAVRELTGAVGLVLVIAGIMLIRPGTGFPGWQAAVPVLGAAALIHAGSSGGSAASDLLRIRPLVQVGLISYSLYLWHWPLIAFARYLNALEPVGAWKWALLATALAIATVSYHFIEKPFRHRRSATGGKRPLLVKSVLAAGVLTATSAIVLAGHGWPGRFTPSVNAFDDERQTSIPFSGCAGQDPLMDGTDNPCLLGADGVEPTMLVWGDSHAIAIAPAFDNLLRRHGRAAVLAVDTTCPPLADFAGPSNPACRRFNARVLEWLRIPGSPRNVAMVAAWTRYAAPESAHVADVAAGDREHPLAGALGNTVDLLHAAGKTLWIIGPTPGAPSDVPLRCAIAEMQDDALPAPRSTREFRESASAFYAAVASLDRGPRLLVTDPSPWFCNASSCAFMHGDRLLYRDGGHLSLHGAAYLEPFLAPILGRMTDRDQTLVTTGRAVASSDPRNHGRSMSRSSRLLH